MENSSNDFIEANGILRFTIKRATTNLFKSFLFALENLADDHDEAYSKLANALPPDLKQYANLVDCLTDERYERLRKLILSNGNDCYRAIEAELDKYDIDFRRQ